MLEQSRRRWTNLKLTVVSRLESTGMALNVWRSLFAPTQHDRGADDIDGSVLEYAIFSTLWTLFTALTSPLTLCDWGIDAVSLQCEAVFLQKKRSKNQEQCSVLFRDPIPVVIHLINSLFHTIHCDFHSFKAENHIPANMSRWSEVGLLLGHGPTVNKRWDQLQINQTSSLFYNVYTFESCKNKLIHLS